MTRRHTLGLGCILLACFACNDSKNETAARPVAPVTETAKLESASRPTTASDTPVVDKLTCPTGCTKISRTEPAPRCCACSGREGLWTKSSFSATTWLCQR